MGSDAEVQENNRRATPDNEDVDHAQEAKAARVKRLKVEPKEAILAILKHTQTVQQLFQQRETEKLDGESMPRDTATAIRIRRGRTAELRP